MVTFRSAFRALLVTALLPPAMAHARATEATETIILLRHGEKPPAGLGQLDCQGLNRALALPAIIAADFHHIDAIFAPNPTAMKKDGGTAYFYIRPLATIEPTAIAFGMTVDISFGEDDWQKLGQAMDSPAYAGKTVLAAWEHTNIVQLARWLMREHGGDPASVPDWNRKDFDSIYVLQIAGSQIKFSRQREGLDGEPAECRKAGGAKPAPPDPPSKL